jgi:hypothetical protein
MGILDRFRSEPRWKHADPAVRLAALQDLEDDDLDALRALAIDDADARVRRAAVRRLGDPQLLAEIARGDADESVREQATLLLVSLATVGADEAEVTVAEAALGGLSDQRHLAAVAKSATVESVARLALGRITDPRALGSVARHAQQPAARLEALSRLDDPREIAVVAMNSEHKDSALEALARLSDREALEQVAARARNRAAARRARALVRALDERQRPDAAALEQDRQAARAAELCAAMESLDAGGDAGAIGVRLASIEEAWDELAGPDEAAASRFRAARARVAERVAAHDRALAERDRQAREADHATAARGELIEEVERLQGDDIGARLAELQRRYDEIDAVRDQDPQRARFERACASAAGRHARWIAARELRDRLQQIAEQAERLAEGPAEDLGSRWPGVRDEWAKLARRGEVETDLAGRFDAAGARIAERQAQAAAARAHAAQENLRRLRQLCDHWEKRGASDQVTLREAERGLREIKSAQENPGHLPTRRDHDDLLQRLRGISVPLFSRVQELREADDWKRWANAGIQEELCRRVEALREVQEPHAAMRHLRQLQDEWKQVSAAPREKAQALWFRFKTAADEVRARFEAHVVKQTEARAENLAKKEALCQRAEALADSTDWIRTADEIKKLQAEWKTVGPSLREKAVWERFRAACDRFFTRRHADLKQRKESWTQNLQRKEAICAQVEALLDTTDWENAATQVRRLQSEWRTIGPVRRNRAEELSQRFFQACERFFERYHRRDQLDLQAKIAERDALVGRLEELAASEAPADLLDQVQAVRRSLAQQASLPRHDAERLLQRFDAALARLTERHPASFQGTDLDPDRNRRRMEELCARVEGYLERGVTPDTALSPTALLARQLREALAANTIGGRVSDEQKWKAAVDAVRDAQAAWKRIGPVPGEAGRALADRFQRACNRFFDQRRRSAAPAPAGSVKVRT